VNSLGLDVKLAKAAIDRDERAFNEKERKE
jgi:hypothetical protein